MKDDLLDSPFLCHTLLDDSAASIAPAFTCHHKNH